MKFVAGRLVDVLVWGKADVMGHAVSRMGWTILTMCSALWRSKTLPADSSYVLLSKGYSVVVILSLRHTRTLTSCPPSYYGSLLTLQSSFSRKPASCNICATARNSVAFQYPEWIDTPFTLVLLLKRIPKGGTICSSSGSRATKPYLHEGYLGKFWEYVYAFIYLNF